MAGPSRPHFGWSQAPTYPTASHTVAHGRARSRTVAHGRAQWCGSRSPPPGNLHPLNVQKGTILCSCVLGKPPKAPNPVFLCSGQGSSQSCVPVFRVWLQKLPILCSCVPGKAPHNPVFCVPGTQSCVPVFRARLLTIRCSCVPSTAPKGPNPVFLCSVHGCAPPPHPGVEHGRHPLPHT